MEVKITDLERTYLRFYNDIISKVLRAKEDEKIYVISLKTYDNFTHNLIVRKSDMYSLKRFLKENNVRM